MTVENGSSGIIPQRRAAWSRRGRRARDLPVQVNWLSVSRLEATWEPSTASPHWWSQAATIKSRSESRAPRAADAVRRPVTASSAQAKLDVAVVGTARTGQATLRHDQHQSAESARGGQRGARLVPIGCGRSRYGQPARPDLTCQVESPGAIQRILSLAIHGARSKSQAALPTRRVRR